jgi:hypothetical protein
MSANRVSSQVIRRAVLLAALLAAGACAEYSPTPPLPTAPLAPEQGATAWLSVPTGVFHAGDHVTVQVNAARARNVSAIGSFTLKVAYDTAGLRYVGTDASAGGMVLAHSANGTVTLAGASGSGFTAVTLGTFIMEVVNPAAIESLALRVEELNTTTFHDQSTRTGVERRVYRMANTR